jgi:hypothetical protein
MVARLVKVVLGSLGLALYTWFAAVRSLPQVRARKAARRLESRSGPRSRNGTGAAQPHPSEATPIKRDVLT